MTHEETIKRIQELVPSVMELEFGCEVLCSDLIQLDVDDYTEGIATILNEKEKILGYIANKTKFETEYRTFEYSKYRVIEILGKPITLAVVLLAIGTTEYANKVGCDATGEMIKMETYRDRIRTKADWNLSKDNFNDQSEETKTFIGGLLNNKE